MKWMAHSSVTFKSTQNLTPVLQKTSGKLDGAHIWKYTLAVMHKNPLFNWYNVDLQISSPTCPWKNPKPYFLLSSILANQGTTQFKINYCKSSQNTWDSIISYTGFQLNSITKQLAILISLIIHNFNTQFQNSFNQVLLKTQHIKLFIWKPRHLEKQFHERATVHSCQIFFY